MASQLRKVNPWHVIEWDRDEDEQENYGKDNQTNTASAASISDKNDPRPDDIEPAYASAPDIPWPMIDADENSPNLSSNDILMNSSDDVAESQEHISISSGISDGEDSDEDLFIVSLKIDILL